MRWNKGLVIFGRSLKKICHSDGRRSWIKRMRKLCKSRFAPFFAKTCFLFYVYNQLDFFTVHFLLVGNFWKLQLHTYIFLMSLMWLQIKIEVNLLCRSSLYTLKFVNPVLSHSLGIKKKSDSSFCQNSTKIILVKVTYQDIFGFIGFLKGTCSLCKTSSRSMS